MFCIVLAAGKGSRMGAIDLPKVCFEIDGVPAINRALATFARCGIEHHVLVIGDRAEQVCATVCERFPKTIFAYQAEQRGTGHAARCGAAVLEAFNYDGDVLVVAGDKVLSERAIREQRNLFQSTGADLCLMVGPRENYPNAGRILEDDPGGIIGIIETNDIARARLIRRWFEITAARPLPADRVRAEMIEAFATEPKARKAMPSVWQALADRPALTREMLEQCFAPGDAGFAFRDSNGAEMRLSGDDVEQRALFANLSVYFFRMRALRYALNRLAAANAQGEEYLTDTIGILANARHPDGRPQFRLISYPIAERADAMAFNSLEELNEIRALYETREKSRTR
jgi:bifunctional N-acetylglucosamine-1-phosphate-uridyltransferase/glucosamine-1-phosphate-acetyltransferase GlmU-like protein